MRIWPYRNMDIQPWIYVFCAFFFFIILDTGYATIFIEAIRIVGLPGEEGFMSWFARSTYVLLYMGAPLYICLILPPFMQRVHNGMRKIITAAQDFTDE